jgi:hypothetical protein
MKGKLFTGSIAVILIAVITALSFAGEESDNSEVLNIEGTYQLISRKLPDGTMQKAPDVMGLLTYTKKHRNFNVIWKDASGKFFSYSLVSTYKLTSTEYTETVLFSIMNDEIGGKKINYDLTGQTRTAPVTIKDGRIEFKMPFDPATLVFDENWITAKAENMFTDYWEKVQ